MKTTIESRKSAQSIFTDVVKGTNFMTNELVGYYYIPNGAAELTTSSTRFMGNAMYGVTVVKDGRKADDLSKCFSDTDRNTAKQEALNYINSLK